MNESLAKQLFNLTSSAKWSIREAVNDEIAELDQNIKNFIEENYQPKQDENQEQK